MREVEGLCLPSPSRMRLNREGSGNQTTFGPTVNFAKTKLMVAGRNTSEADAGPLKLGEEEVECVEKFPYLESIVAASGTVDAEVDRRIAQASKAFGALRKPVFQDKNLSLHTKRAIYKACGLTVLLYSAECWIPLRKHLRKIDTFHHRYIRATLELSRRDQWTQQSHLPVAGVTLYSSLPE